MPRKTKIFLFTIAVMLLMACIWAYVKPSSQVSSDGRTITVARCVGYCNLSLFLASRRTDVENSDLRIKLKYIANPGDHVSALESPGGPQAAVTPFTNVITGFGNNHSVRIIAGSGMNGLAILARPDIKSIDDLRGRRLGTFRADTLEALGYDAVKRSGLEKQVQFVYFAEALEPLTALKNGEVDAITHVEPFVSQLSAEHKMNILLRGEDLWETDHPDCVLISTVKNIKEHRDSLKKLILEMLVSQAEVEKNLPAVAKDMAQPFYQMSPEELIKAARAQFPQVDITDKKEFILSKGQLLVDLGYIKSPPSEELFDFSLLEEVIKENPQITAELQHKSRNPRQK